MGSGSRRLLASGAALMFVALSGSAAWAQSTVTGRVTSTGSGQPVAGAHILVLSGTTSAVAGDDGRYTLRNVPAGHIDLQVLAVGHKSVKKSVVIVAGETATMDFQLDETVTQLNDVVVTSTGQIARRQELGNAISTLGNVTANVETKPITDVTDMMIAKTPGVIVLPSPVLGGAPVLRIRGSSSLSLSNAPIWVVDGVRYNVSTTNSSGQTPISMLNNLSPEEIEDVEIVKGPSAATLYGTNAANGVVVITTKKGRAGKTRWNYSAETRSIVDRNAYPASDAAWGHSSAPPPALGLNLNKRCLLSQMNNPNATPAYVNPNLPAASQCNFDSLTTYNPFADPSNTMLGIGRGSLFAMNVSGGNDAVRFFASGDGDNEFGPVQMPAPDIQYYDNVLHTPVSSQMLHPRQQQKLNFRSNLSATVNPKLDLNINAGYGKSTNIIEPDNSLIIALVYTGEAGYGYKGCPATPNGTAAGIPANTFVANGPSCGLDKPYADNTGFPLHDYNSFAPGSVMQYVTPVDLQRFTSSGDANWRPFSWMQNDATVGIDLALQDVYHLCKLNECPPQGATSRLGNVNDTKTNRRNFSAKGSSTGTWQARPSLNLKTTVGTDYTNEENDQTSASSQGLAPGSTLLSQGSTILGASYTPPTAVKTLGYYIQEQAGFNDRLFVTLAARQDQNSAFGSNFQKVIYPKASVSWIISDEDFFPKFSFLDALRLRTAYGANGVQPGATSALALFSSVSASATKTDANTGTDVSGLAASSPGNVSLKPETSAEFEAGFETDFLSRRLHLGYTYYNKKTHDALINVPLAASAGPSTTSLLENVGSTQNYGSEVDLTAQIFTTRMVAWDVTVSGSHNTNKWLELGIDPTTGVERIIGVGSQQEQIKGYSLNAQWFKNYHYADANGDGILQQCGVATVAANNLTQTCNEVIVDSARFNTGYNTPRDLFSIQNGFDLFDRKLRINMSFDYKGGGNTVDETNGFDCTSAPYGCAETADKSTQLAWQARAIAATYGTVIGDTTKSCPTPAGTCVVGTVANQQVQKSQLGYYESDQFWRFREFSAVYQLPPKITNWLRSQNGSTIVFGMRNLHVWTKFTGPDPEANYGLTQSDVQNEFNTAPQPTYYTLRLNLKY